MKPILYIFIVILFSVNICAGQHTKHIIIKPTKPDNIKEDMIVLKSNPHIKKGKYSKYKNKILIEKGYYSYNQKDSLWEYFSKAGKLMAKGLYKDGTKKGIWEYYSFGGDLIQKYNHDKDSLIYYNIEKENILYPYLAPKNNDTNVRMSYFIGGLGNLYRVLENDIIYPQTEFKLRKTATVKVTFTIDIFGYTTHAKVLPDSNIAFNNEAIRVVESLGKSWTTCIIHGRKVSMSYMLPVKFELL